MRNFILADNQELTRFALESLLRQDKEATVYRVSDKASLVALLKEHEAAVVLLDYTLFDFSDEDQLLIVAERFSLSDWILISDELTSQFLRRVVYSSHQFSIVFKDGPLQEVREAQYPDRNRDGNSACYCSGQDHQGDCYRTLCQHSHYYHPPQEYLP